MIDVYWFDDVNGSYKVEIEILSNDRSGLFLIWSNGSNEMSLKAIFLVFQRVPGKQKHLPPQ